MRKLISISLFFLILSLITSSTFALLVTDNVDRDKFQYEKTLVFSTANLAQNITTAQVPISSIQAVDSGQDLSFFYLVSRGGGDNALQGRIVGISASASRIITAGAATFDVTVNNAVTGIQAVIEAGVSSSGRAAVGNDGAAYTQYGYFRHDRFSDVAEKGFNMGSTSPSQHNKSYPYGIATPLTAGNRIGVNVTTSATMTPNNVNDFTVVVYVLE